MNIEFTDVLYSDPQKKIPAAFCSTCGGERFWPDLICLRCGRRAHDAA